MNDLCESRSRVCMADGGYVKRTIALVFGAATLYTCMSAIAQQQSLTGFVDASAPLFFKEDWKHDFNGAREGPISQKHLANRDLELKLFGDPASHAAWWHLGESDRPERSAAHLHRFMSNGMRADAAASQ